MLDLLYTHPDIIVTHMQDMPIQQDLLGVKSAKLSNVRTVISHPQALAQSSVFLQQLGFATQSWINTADAAKHIAELNDPTVAAIASAETAELYGLDILAEGVNADGDNTTRFIVIERAAQPPVMTLARGSGFPCCLPPATSPVSWPWCWTRSVPAALTWSASKAAPCPMYLLSIIFMYSLSVPLAAMPPPAIVCWKP